MLEALVAVKGIKPESKEGKVMLNLLGTVKGHLGLNRKNLELAKQVSLAVVKAAKLGNKTLTVDMDIESMCDETLEAIAVMEAQGEKLLRACTLTA